MTATRYRIPALLLLLIAATSLASQGRVRHNYAHYSSANTDTFNLRRHELTAEDSMRPRSLAQLEAELDSTVTSPLSWNPFRAPNILSNYISRPRRRLNFEFKPVYAVPDTTGLLIDNAVGDIEEETSEDIVEVNPTAAFTADNRLAEAARLSRQAMWMQYNYLVHNPDAIEYAQWELPQPPELPDDDYSFIDYLSGLKLNTPNGKPTFIPKPKIKLIHWLHKFDGGIQFSQAYLSKNWYQGGNDYLALLINFYWNVKLNQAYHPNLLFENTISYKLGLNSTHQDQYHKYSISEDLLQWNLNLGLKAREKWYYSLTSQFKTQILNNYPSDSQVRTAAFLSPGELNVGLGMTYSTANAKNTLKFKAAISPLSYNLRMCLSNAVDPTPFNIEPGKHFHSEIGSSAELTLDWAITSNINYRSRLFIFSDYRNYTQDWENTISFSINKFLSTQVYWHLRYDTGTDSSLSSWKHWMLKEILSFGFAYSFSTK